MTQIPHAPTRFDGTLSELYERWAKTVLLSQSSVEQFHAALVSYLKSPDPLFLARKVGNQERGQIIRNRLGHQMRATDNSPAWWIHANLWNGNSLGSDNFEAVIDAVPSHMFHVKLRESINSAGGHVAHIFDAKDRDTAYEEWDRQNLTRRMIRNIHPCNCFYIPTVDWRAYGGDPAVIAFFYDKFAQKYSGIWNEFLELADAIPPAIQADPTYRYRIPILPELYPDGEPEIARDEDTSRGGRLATQYRSTRLAFKADLIEPLDMDASFRIDTPNGSYEMTKRDFYRVFPRVVVSRSYRDDRLYSFPTPPKRAQQFLIKAALHSNTH